MAWHWTHPDNGRWQEIRLEHDLLGTIVLVTRAGGPRRACLTILRYPVANRNELRRCVRSLNARRRRHGYQLLQ